MNNKQEAIGFNKGLLYAVDRIEDTIEYYRDSKDPKAVEAVEALKDVLNDCVIRSVIDEEEPQESSCKNSHAYYKRKGLVDATFRKHTALGRKLAIEITIGDAIKAYEDIN